MERQKALKNELQTLSGALKTQYEKNKKEYEGQCFPHVIRCSILIHSVLVISFIISFQIIISDLPEDTPLVDLHKMAGLDVSKLPKMETSGRDCIRNVQEWMFSERSSKECAVLPEDTLQRILVGVSIST